VTETPEEREAASSTLQDVVVEIERHVAENGWDGPPQVFALVDTLELAAAEPALAARLGILPLEVAAGSLTPVEQEPLGDEPLDEVLAKMAWPDDVLGCALVQEVIVLPPEVEAARPEDVDPVDWAAGHPERQEARMAVGVLRDGSRAAALRLRGQNGDTDEDPGAGEVLVGDDLVPNLAEALLATLD